MSGREWAPEEVAELIREKKIGPLTGFRSKMGRPFAASLKFNAEFRAEFDFGQSLDDEEAPDFSALEPVGACPKCASKVYEHGSGYICEKATGPARTCDFRSGRIILQQEISVEQMKKLLNTGRTDLLTDFVSNKSRRKFKAFLVKQPDGKIGFEFMQRAAKPGAAEKSTESGAGKAPAKKSAAGKKLAATTDAGAAGAVPGKKTAVKKAAAATSVAKKAAAKKTPTKAAKKVTRKA